MFLHGVGVLCAISLGKAAYLEQRDTATPVPQYFQTAPELYAGKFP